MPTVVFLVCTWGRRTIVAVAVGSGCGSSSMAAITSRHNDGVPGRSLQMQNDLMFFQIVIVFSFHECRVPRVGLRTMGLRRFIWPTSPIPPSSRAAPLRCRTPSRRYQSASRSCKRRVKDSVWQLAISSSNMAAITSRHSDGVPFRS